MTVDLIVAMDERNGIGKNGGLPWDLPADLRHFREITTGPEPSRKPNVVVMGRRTWHSIPERYRPLPARINVVLSRNPAFSVPEGVHLARNFGDLGAVLSEKHPKWGDIFVIGGQQIYETALREADCRRFYITRIHGDFGCDAFFPTVPPRFRRISTGPVHTENGIDFSFQVYEA